MSEDEKGGIVKGWWDRMVYGRGFGNGEREEAESKRHEVEMRLQRIRAEALAYLARSS